MPDNLSANDPKTIWQHQPTEPSDMTLEKLRQRSRELHAKTRRDLFANTMLSLLAVAFSGYGILHAHPPLLLFFALAFAWAGVGQYFLHRGMWLPMTPADAALRTGLEFYRGEIERQRSLFRRVLQWSFGPLALAIGTWIFLMTGFAVKLGKSAAAVLPFATLFVIWFVTILVQRSRARKALDREMDELNELDRERLH